MDRKNSGCFALLALFQNRQKYSQKQNQELIKMKQNFLIMGGNGGIGEALAVKLANDGHKIIVTMRQPENAPDKVKSRGIDIRKADVCDPDTILSALSDFQENKPLSGFAYCIGSIDLMPLKTAKDEHFLKSYEVNVLGAVRALKILEKSLKAAKGSVVLFSSIAAQQGFSNHTVISTAKGAIEGLTKALAAEWAGHVRVNAIAPSLTDTAIATPLTSSASMREAIEKMHPIPRLGTPEDSTALAAFLLPPSSGWITGQILHVDGGRSTLRPKG
jgi:NAD(P)-dependent dehydrogenase (short-subunit alcohol dehydrogenase family)